MPIKSPKTCHQLPIPLENTSDQIPPEESDLYLSFFKHHSNLIIKPNYCHKNGLIFTADSLEWMHQINDGTIDLIFADPPYNIKKANWDKFESQEQYIEWTSQWLQEAQRILKPKGSLYVCGFSEILADIKYSSKRYFKSCKWLVWSYRNKANLGNGWGRSHESILHLKNDDNYKINVDSVRIPYGAHTLKYPHHPQAITSQYGNGKRNSNSWFPNPEGAKPKDVFEIPVICNGMKEKTNHPTQKPEELLRKILYASSSQGETVLDPFSGSGTTLVVAEQLGRKWIGCDINAEYNNLAIERIKNVEYKPEEEWIATDKENAKRRESIR
jgi:site-specific DNA-methyltransferase (adenine-specific)